MTVEQLTANLTWRELVAWSEYFDAKAEAERKANRRISRGHNAGGQMDVDFAEASDDAIAGMFRARKATRH
jgi:hypothetical protein